MDKHGRSVDPNTQYRVRVHKMGKYLYACTQRTTVDEKTGQKRRKHVHWGRVDAEKRFHPNLTFLKLPAEERRRLIFPKDWDLSQIDVLLPDTNEGQQGHRS